MGDIFGVIVHRKNNYQGVNGSRLARNVSCEAARDIFRRMCLSIRPKDPGFSGMIFTDRAAGGGTYNTNIQVSSLKTFAPPSEMISSPEADDLFAAHPYNSLNSILGYYTTGLEGKVEPLKRSGLQASGDVLSLLSKEGSSALDKIKVLYPTLVDEVQNLVKEELKPSLSQEMALILSHALKTQTSRYSNTADVNLCREYARLKRMVPPSPFFVIKTKVGDDIAFSGCEDRPVDVRAFKIPKAVSEPDSPAGETLRVDITVISSNPEAMRAAVGKAQEEKLSSAHHVISHGEVLVINNVNYANDPTFNIMPMSNIFWGSSTNA